MIEIRVDNVGVQIGQDTEKSVVNCRVLFIEQSSENTHKIMKMLRSMPRYPITVSVISVAEANQDYARQFDVVLIDVSTPQPPNWEVFGNLCKTFRELPMIVLSDNEHQGIEALRLGAKDYLIEGEVTARTLGRTIRYSLEHCAVLKDLKTAKIQEESARAKSDHLLDLSSQLKAPINVLLGFTEVMHQGQLGSVGSAKYEDYIADTHKCATHLNSLLDNMLKTNNPHSIQ